MSEAFDPDTQNLVQPQLEPTPWVVDSSGQAYKLSEYNLGQPAPPEGSVPPSTPPAGEANPAQPDTPDASQEAIRPKRAPNPAQSDILRKFVRVENWFDPENVLSLQQSIDADVDKKTREAHLLGDHYQVGFDKHRVRSEATQRYLEKYFGATTEELEEGKKVPQWIQDKVASLLEMKPQMLELIATKIKIENPNQRRRIDSYINNRLKPTELRELDKEIKREVVYIVGGNKKLLGLPLVKEAYKKITDQRDKELYLGRLVNHLSRQKVHRANSVPIVNINSAVRQTTEDLRAHSKVVQKWRERESYRDSYRDNSRAA